MPYGGPPLDCLDTAVDCFSGVRLVSVATVLRCWSRRGRYITTMIVALWPNALLHEFPLQSHLCGTQNVVKAQEWPRAFPLTLTTVSLSVY